MTGKPVCSICGGVSFEEGPQGRRTASGRPPRCSRCGSLERHRIARRVLDHLHWPNTFRDLRALQFSREPTLKREWFHSLEVSLFGSANSLDLQHIARRDASYGFIMCCHVLEHVPDYRRGLREIERILAPEGLAYMAWPNSIVKSITEDWGYADPGNHGHFRTFGRDFERHMGRILSACHVLAVEERDPATDVDDRHYVISKTPLWRNRLLLLQARVETLSEPSRV